MRERKKERERRSRRPGMGRASAAAAALLLVPAAVPAVESQEPTRVLVRAVSKDAKVIGSGVGGARIAVRDAATGEVLAEGVQEGSTGSTEAIMVTPRPRGLTAYGADPEAAGFLAELSLDRPTRVEIVAEGPLGTPHAVQRASKTLLVVPGYDVLGEGVILELNGFTVELLSPAGPAPAEVAGTTGSAAGSAKLAGSGAASAAEDPLPVDRGPLAVRVRVTMLCGCPTEPGGMWDADGIEVFARLIADGEEMARERLGFSGERSVFVGTLPDPGDGPAALEVIAADPERANFGMVRREVRAAP